MMHVPTRFLNWLSNSMTTKTHSMIINGIDVEIARKSIKNLHLGVYPPDGRVRVAAPLAVNDDSVRLAVINKLAWIKRQKTKFDAQSRQSQRSMVSGESHYFLGHRYRLRVIEHSETNKVVLHNKVNIHLYVRTNSDIDQRKRILMQWYRDQLKDIVPKLLEKWQTILDVQVTDWGVRKMKTKWGSCSIKDKRIWLNLELAKKPVQSIEYIIVHELVHLLERNHNDRFTAIMDNHMPTWRTYKDELNITPLGHETWSY